MIFFFSVLAALGVAFYLLSTLISASPRARIFYFVVFLAYPGAFLISRNFFPDVHEYAWVGVGLIFALIAMPVLNHVYIDDPSDSNEEARDGES